MGRLFIFITVDSKEVRQWTLLHHIPQRVKRKSRGSLISKRRKAKS